MHLYPSQLSRGRLLSLGRLQCSPLLSLCHNEARYKGQNHLHVFICCTKLHTYPKNHTKLYISILDDYNCTNNSEVELGIPALVPSDSDNVNTILHSKPPIGTSVKSAHTSTDPASSLILAGICKVTVASVECKES